MKIEANSKKQRSCRECDAMAGYPHLTHCKIGLEAALAQARAELELAKSDLAMAHRVVERHKEAEANAVRIGCENIAAREKAEAALKEAQAKLLEMTTDRDEWKEATIAANQRFKQAEAKLAAAQSDAEKWEKRSDFDFNRYLKAEFQAAELRRALETIAKAVEGHAHQWCDHANDAPSDSCQIEQIAREAIANFPASVQARAEREATTGKVVEAANRLRQHFTENETAKWWVESELKSSPNPEIRAMLRDLFARLAALGGEAKEKAPCRCGRPDYPGIIQRTDAGCIVDPTWKR